MEEVEFWKYKTADTVPVLMKDIGPQFQKAWWFAIRHNKQIYTQRYNDKTQKINQIKENILKVTKIKSWIPAKKGQSGDNFLLKKQE